MERKEEKQMFKDKLIYLAVPYTHSNEAIEERRFEIVTRVSAELAKRKISNISPITQSHLQNRMVNIPGTWDFWKNIDKIILEKCDVLVVLRLNGWDESIGVMEEMDIALNNNIPIIFLDLEFGKSDTTNFWMYLIFKDINESVRHIIEIDMLNGWK
jgi:hypothetical protein